MNQRITVERKGILAVIQMKHRSVNLGDWGHEPPEHQKISGTQVCRQVINN